MLRIRDAYPGFRIFPHLGSRIPDLRSRKQKKEKVKLFFYLFNFLPSKYELGAHDLRVYGLRENDLREYDLREYDLREYDHREFDLREYDLLVYGQLFFYRYRKYLSQSIQN